MHKDRTQWIENIRNAFTKRLEANEIDFKEDLSEDNDRLIEHLNAFGNSDFGGVFVFGVNRKFVVLDKLLDHEKISERLTNLARDSQSPSLAVETFFCDLEGRSLLTVYVKPGVPLPVFIKSRLPFGGSGCFKRSGASTLPMSDNEIRERLARSNRYFIDETEVQGTSLEDLDLPMISGVIQNFRLLDGGTPGNINILLDHKILRGSVNDYGVTMGGLLVFGNNPQSQRQFKNAFIEFQQFRNSTREEPIKKLTITGNLPHQVQEAIAVMLQHVWVMPHIQGTKRVELPSYTEEMLREVITNSVVHRDYSKMHQPVKIALFKDRFEVENPGGLLPGLTPLNLIHKREWRNPTLAELLAKFKLGDMDGQGVDRLYAATRTIRVPAPIFLDNQAAFKAILSGPKKFDDFSPEEKRLTVLILLIMEDVIENESLRNAFGIDAAKATTLIKALIDEGVIISTTNSRKYAKYRLTEIYRQKVFG